MVRGVPGVNVRSVSQDMVRAVDDIVEVDMIRASIQDRG